MTIMSTIRSKAGDFLLKRLLLFKLNLYSRLSLDSIKILHLIFFDIDEINNY